MINALLRVNIRWMIILTRNKLICRSMSNIHDNHNCVPVICILFQRLASIVNIKVQEDSLSYNLTGKFQCLHSLKLSGGRRHLK